MKNYRKYPVGYIIQLQMTDSEKYHMYFVCAHMDYIKTAIHDVDSEIESLITSDPHYPNAIKLLYTILGVKRNSTITTISEIGIDISQFFTSKRLCC